MARLLAEDLMVLCWHDARGKPHPACADVLAGGVGGALLLDALRTDLLAVDGGRVRPTGLRTDDSLLAEVVHAAHPRPRPASVEGLVGRLGTWDGLAMVRRRLLDAGLLHAERTHLLGIVAVTRYPVSDPDTVSAVRQGVGTLLTGQREAHEAHRREVLLAALAEPTNAVNRLVPRSERRAARQRATSFAEDHGVPEELTEAVRHSRTMGLPVGGG